MATFRTAKEELTEVKNSAPQIHSISCTLTTLSHSTSPTPLLCFSSTSILSSLLFSLTLVLISERYKLKSLNFLSLHCLYLENCLGLPFTSPFLKVHKTFQMFRYIHYHGLPQKPGSIRNNFPSVLVSLRIPCYFFL